MMRRALIIALWAAMLSPSSMTFYADDESSGDVGVTESVQALIEKLRHKDPAVRESAVKSLVTLGPAAIDPLVGAYVHVTPFSYQSKEDCEFQEGVVSALASSRDPRSIQVLLRALSTFCGGSAIRAADTLATLNEPRAVIPLARRAHNSPVYQEDVTPYGEALERLAVVAVESLLAEVRVGDDSEDLSAAENALRYITDPAAVPLLIAALQEEAPLVRSYATAALGKIGGAVAFEHLVATLRDDNALVRTRAAKALAKVGTSRAVDPLVNLLKDNNDAVRWTAAEALANIGTEASERALLAEIATKDLLVVAAAAPFFIKAGQSGSEALLASALNAYGSSIIVQRLQDRQDIGVELLEVDDSFLLQSGNLTLPVNFALSGNKELEKSSRKWAKQHGLKVKASQTGKVTISSATVRRSFMVVNMPKWGSKPR